MTEYAVDHEMALDPTDFWLSSGHMLLDVTPEGRLAVTDQFLKAYLARPELMPPPEACDAERTLHARLMATPKADIGAEDIVAIADKDAQSNWRVVLDFRDHLLKASTLEAAYIALVRQGPGKTPPLFMNQLVHVIARQALRGCDDPFVLRAGEMLFRTQRVTVHDGSVLLADDEVLSMKQKQIERAPLLAMFAGETAQMDILVDKNASAYLRRSDTHDFILEFGTMTGGRAAFAKVLQCWIAHLLGLSVEIEPLARIEDRDVRWLLGLDAEGTRIGNALWTGELDANADGKGPLAIFRINPDQALPFIDSVKGKPVYLLLGMDADRMVRVKPQNLLTSLPLTVLTALN